MTEANLPVMETETSARPRRGRLGLGSIVLLVGIVLTLAVFGWALARRNQTQPTGGPAPDFSFTSFDGQEIRLADLRGQVVVVNFWASWCGPCRVEAPDLQRIHEKYKDRGVVVLGITYTDTDAKSLAFIEEFGMTYPNGPDLGVRISDRYNIQGVPETFVIDQQGNIAKFIFAPTNERDLSAIIDQLLAAA
jgi:cytochrome c biogenesis protein CcmG/thiol:disulfide interchange protein DsbE